MYSAAQPVSTSMNGMGGGIIDGSGTINPAALNSAGKRFGLLDGRQRPTRALGCLSVPASSSRDSSRHDLFFVHFADDFISTAILSNPTASDTSPRGVKRSRSPDTYDEVPATGEGGDDTDDQKPRKRGRPPKTKQSPTISTTQAPATAAPAQVQTPQTQNQSLPKPSSAGTPTKASPPKATPTKSVVKALPTVRDHTTDQLGPDGDEYIPREYDDAGERKVTPTGHPLDNRVYRCRTFFVPNRHNKLFMLATECARVLGYRDSYLLFNKNRSLYKIIATQAEKDDLIQQEVLPYSYRSRQIAIVTAKSMFRQFGSRVIVNGRRVRDDYWESKARKQGFTEEDMAGEKRPGAAKARDAAAAEAASAGTAALAPTADIVYSNGPSQLDHLQTQGLQPGMGGAAASLAPLPMILPPTDDLRARDYGNVQRPRQEMSGQPYQDRTQPSNVTEIMNQAQHTADFNRALGQQRGVRGKYMDDYWNKPRDPPVSTHPQSGGQMEPDVSVTHALPSPGLTGGIFSPGSQQTMQHQTRAPSQMINPSAYTQQPHQQNTIAQSPVRGMPQGSMRPDQMHHRSPRINMGQGTPGQAPNPYAYQHHPGMWPPPAQHQSPLPQSHHSMSQYSPHAPHATPHQQSPHQQQPQLHHVSPMPGGQSMPYQGMPNMGGAGYGGGAVGRGNVYQPNAAGQHFVHQSAAGHQPGLQQWAPQQQQGSPGNVSQAWGWGSSG
ncbi:MAG: hypothetical protein M1817_001596 [Caeruleum heppii]|nr:MAG: hypothetical protein M1817_001596 [Caeruleum heppii]